MNIFKRIWNTLVYTFAPDSVYYGGRPQDTRVLAVVDSQPVTKTRAKTSAKTPVKTQRKVKM